MYQFLKELVLAGCIVWACCYAMASSGMVLKQSVAYTAITGVK